MDLVIDANILFAVSIKSGKTEDLVFSECIHLFAPEFLFEEFEKYKEYILSKTKRPSEDFHRFLEILESKITIIPNDEFQEFVEYAKEICPDPNDLDYFALALKLNCPIWTNETRLGKQSTVKVYTTKELIVMFRL